MKKVFISIPMMGEDKRDIWQKMQDLMDKFAKQILPEYPAGRSGLFLIDSIHYDDLTDGDHPLMFLGKSIQLMSKADVVIFADGWSRARGCNMEHTIAEAYNLPIAYEMDGAINRKNHDILHMMQYDAVCPKCSGLTKKRSALLYQCNDCKELYHLEGPGRADQDIKVYSWEKFMF